MNENYSWLAHGRVTDFEKESNLTYGFLMASRS
jgi:hypothetical protein